MIRSIRQREGGQSLAEFALMLPIFLILVFGIIDFGMGLRAYITTAQASREGARYASIGNQGATVGYVTCNSGTTNPVVVKTCSTMGGLNKANASVRVEYPSGNAPGNSVRISTKYDYNYITPLRRLVTFFSAGSLGSSIPLSSSVDMRLE